MQTYSHALISAALNEGFGDKSPIKVDSWALIAGSFSPDVPLFILTLIFFAQRPEQSGFGAAYDALYFGDPVWIIGHSLLHAPPMVLLYLTVGYWFGVRGDHTWARMLFWFGVGCGLHTTVDILTHHDDGPLLLFPFNWELRFSSPISYWDPDHGGRIFAPLEHLLDVGIMIYLMASRLIALRRRQSS